MRCTGLVLWCLWVAVAAFAQQGINASPDTILYNGKIITVDSSFRAKSPFHPTSRSRSIYLWFWK